MRAIIAIVALLAAVLLVQLWTRRMRAHQRQLKAIIERHTSELARRARELEEANREIKAANQTKSRFLASMSHELRTPLNAILGFSEVLSARLDDRADARKRKFLQNINESGQHPLSLINDRLDLSKIEAGHMELHAEPLEVAPLIERIRALLAGMASRQEIEIVVTSSESLPPVSADESKLRQILFNLLSNAIKFSHADSRAEIEVTFLPAKRSPIRIDSIVIAVTDHGIGIKPEDRRMLFDEFHQADEGVARSGTGLGLSIVKKLTELHRGIVTVDSKPGVGSTLRVYLPAATSATAYEPRIVNAELN